MAQNSAIELSSKHPDFGQDHSIYQIRMRIKSFTYNPVYYVLIFFGAITILTGSDYIPRCCFSTFRYWDNVVPRFSLGSAVHTFSISSFQDIILRLGGDGPGSSFSAMGVLASFFAISFIRKIPFSGLRVFTSRTYTPLDGIKRQPLLATSTPSQANSGFFLSFSPFRSLGYSLIIAILTRTLQAASSTGVFVKTTNWFPGFTSCAPVKSGFDILNVFFKRYTDSFGCYLQNSNLASHFSPGSVYLVHSIIS